MTALSRALALTVTAVLAPVALSTPATAATSSCVAQSAQAEHELYGTEWGHELVGFLASHPHVLAELGFDGFGDLASYAARQDHANCPADL